MLGVSIIPTRFPNFAGIFPTRWLLERSRMWSLVRFEIQSGIEPWRDFFCKFRILKGGDLTDKIW